MDKCWKCGNKIYVDYAWIKNQTQIEPQHKCGHKKESVVNGHCYKCDVVCSKCHGTGDVVIEGHICDCVDCDKKNHIDNQPE